MARRHGRTATPNGSFVASAPSAQTGYLSTTSTTPVRCSATTNATSTTTVHTKASTSTHQTMTPASSSRSTPRYGEPESSAVSSTSTSERPDPISKAPGHRHESSFGTVHHRAEVPDRAGGGAGSAAPTSRTPGCRACGTPPPTSSSPSAGPPSPSAPPSRPPRQRGLVRSGR